MPRDAARQVVDSRAARVEGRSCRVWDWETPRVRRAGGGAGMVQWFESWERQGRGSESCAGAEGSR